MNYQETIEFLFSSLPMFQRTGAAAYKANLDNTLEFDRVLGHPHRLFRSVHVAGTNGKGSVSHMLASVFQVAGYRTGLYTSPHLLDFRERIRIDGKLIHEKHVVEFVERNRAVIERIQPSFFEMTVAMAFDHFAREKVDMAIIETGMGGRLDSTNIIVPEISVITSISKDHTEFLGDTIEKIAGEKAGIIKEGVPVVLGKNEPSVRRVIEKTASAKNAAVILSDEQRRYNYRTLLLDSRTLFHYTDIQAGKELAISSDLGGDYQGDNINTFLAAVSLLKKRFSMLSDAAVNEALLNVKRNTGLRGRWELLGSNPRIICDTAHNAGGIKLVMEQLGSVPAKKMHIVWGMVSDKSPELILPLLPKNAEYYFTQPSIPRGMPVDRLLSCAKTNQLNGGAYPTVEKAFLAAREKAGPDDTVFIGGSTFVVADLLEKFSGMEKSDNQQNT